MSEISIEHSIDYWIQGRVTVTGPKADIKHYVGDTITQSRDYIQREKRCPADDKSRHHYS